MVFGLLPTGRPLFKDTVDALEMRLVLGDLKTRPTAALETQAAFLCGLPSHVLYMWELFESEGMLSFLLSRLSDIVCVSKGSPGSIGAVAPILSCAGKKRKVTDYVEEFSLKVVLRIKAEMENDRQHSRVISIRDGCSLGSSI